MKTSSILHQIMTLLLLSITISATAAVTKPAAPDFAYPQKVSANAEKRLEAALKTDDGISAIRALIDIALAQSAISVDNLPKVLNRIDEMTAKENDSCTKALLNLLSAEIYSRIYNDSKWKFDQRKLPLTPLPENYSEWSGEQFHGVIAKLCDDAMSHREALQNARLADYSSIITADKETLIYYPTLYDFVADATIAIRKKLSSFYNTFSIFILTPKDIFAVTPIYLPTSEQAKAILDTYAELLRFHANDTAPLIRTDIERIDFITNGVYSTMHERAELKKHELLLQLYHQYANSEYSGDILLELAENEPDSQQWAKELYSYRTAFVKRFPAYHRTECIQNRINIQKQKRIRISTPENVAPNKEFDIKITATNINTATIKIYRLSADSDPYTDNYIFKKSAPPTLVKTLQVSIGGTVPFNTDTIISTTVPDYGCYIAVPESDGLTVSKNHTLSKINCSELAIGRCYLTDSELIVINPLTGAPVSEADIYFKSSRRNTTAKKIGLTDTDGFLKYTLDQYGQAYASKGNKRRSTPIYIPYFSYEEPEWNQHSRTFTDLAIYHPGDSVKWSSIVYETKGVEQRLIRNREMSVILRNVNYIALDTVQATTDEYGRIDGRFALPQGELTGNYTIELQCEGHYYGNESFMVSDYKTPTYFIEINNAVQAQPAEGDITLTGSVRTYSGMNMAGIPLQINLSVSERGWWRMSNDVEFYSATDTTDSNGAFSIVLPKILLDTAPVPDGLFKAKITATSNTGENRESTKNFTRGTAYDIYASLPSDIDVTTPVRLNVKVTDGANRQIDKTIDYSITRNGKAVMSSSFQSSAPIVDWNKIPAGEYDITFTIAENPTDSTRVSGIRLYRPSDQLPPVDDPLWTPYDNQTLVTDNNRKIDILYGTSADENHILYILSDSKNIFEQRWITTGAGMHRLEVKLPENTDQALITLSSTNNFKTSRKRINIKAPDTDKSIKILTESFRDNIIPGSEETWTFRTIDQDSTGIASAMILGMYNEALDALMPYSLQFSPQAQHSTSLTLDIPDYGLNFTTLNSKINNRICNSLSAPEFQFYGMKYVFSINQYVSRGLNGRLYGVSIHKDDEATVLFDVVESVPELKQAVKSSADMGNATGALERASEEEVATATAEENNEQNPTAPDFEYREGETPLAFFRPQLNTDSSGHLSFTFSVPNANTTWRFNAVAYTPDLRTANFTSKVMANKPVMVQPNLPRFLRTGDNAVIKASVMNNTDEESTISTRIELFDPTSTQIIAAYDTIMAISAKASGTADFTITAPTDAPFIGYRIKSSTDYFTDGEQSLIPILPSITPVIETAPFYLAADTSEYTMRLPEISTDARVTLQFCNNPVWYVVTALPGLRNSEPRTAPEAADAIFSASVANGLLHSYPAIANAIRQWDTSNRSDSTLVSMLERNADLKTVLLQATPWMMDARSDTERMQRLSLLFDKNEIEATISSSISLLKKLQRTNGGFAWFDQCNEPSVWATSTTLRTLGRLNRLGYMPSDKTLESICTRALSYYKKEIENDYIKYPKGDYTDYVILCDMWPSDKQSLTGQTITAKVVQNIIKNWRSLRIEGKAQAAMILNRHGHPKTAVAILNSMREFAETSPTKGMWWPSVGDRLGGSMTQLVISAEALTAFQMLQPGCPEINAIRQWLILQKETRNWGSSSSASLIIAAILTTSTNWSQETQPAELTLDGKKIIPTDVEQILGYFRTDISEMSSTGSTLKISKSGQTPAWGAIYTQSRALMTTVKASGCEAVDIEKHIFKQIGNEWVDANDIRIGDRVKVQLTIHADRDIEYVAITDDRAACFEPVDQLPQPIYAEGVLFYRENRNDATTMFVTHMPKGTYLLTYELWANNAGTFASGIATLQSQYAPQISAHSAGNTITVTP